MLAASADLKGSLAICAAGLAAVAIYALRLRHAERSIVRFDEEIEAKLKRGEMKGPEASWLVIQQRRKSVGARAARSSLAFAIAAVLATPFMKSFPLNAWFRPWGEIMLTICLAAFLLVVLDCATIANEWVARREFEK